VPARKRVEPPPQARPAVGRLSDGTPYHAPLGELVLSADQGRVCCHLCGRWFRALAPAHLRLVHDWEHLEYKEAFGLTSLQPLQAPDLRERHREVITELLKTDRRVGDALRVAQERMRSARLAADLRYIPSGPQPLAHRRKSQAMASRASRINQQRSEAARLELVRSLGFRSVAAYLQRRYVKDHYSLAEIVAELRTGLGTLGRLMHASHIEVRSNVAATQERRRMQTLTELRDGTAPDGHTWRAYFRSRIRRGVTVNAIAIECGRSRDWVVRVLRLLEIDW
jgi:predicted transcriptional regulator